MLTQSFQKTGCLCCLIFLSGLAGCSGNNESIAEPLALPEAAAPAAVPGSAGQTTTASSAAPPDQVRLINSVAGAQVPDTQGSDTVLFTSSAANANNVTIQASSSATLSWDGATANTDGSLLTDLAGYRVYQGSTDQLTIIQQLIFASPGGRRSTSISNVSEGNNCFAITAFDNANNESTLSEVTCLDLSVATPPAPDEEPEPDAGTPGATAPTSPSTPTSPPSLPSAFLPAANLALLPSEPPAPSPDRPIVTGVAQVDRVGALATIRISWLAPSTNETIRAYTIYRGTQSQLTKVAEIDEVELDSSRQRVHDLANVPGDQTCVALTAISVDNNETALGNIFCVALDPLPANPTAGSTTNNLQLRPFNVSAVNTGAGTAEVQWDRPSAVTANAVGATSTAIAAYDLYQGSANSLTKKAEIVESGGLSQRRSFSASNLSADNNCFAVTAIDATGTQSALSEMACTATTNAADNNRLGVSGVIAQYVGDNTADISWNTPTGIVEPGEIENLSGYSLYQGSNSQLFRVVDIPHDASRARQTTQRTGVVDTNTNCFALTAFDTRGNESPLSLIDCADVGAIGDAPTAGPVAAPTSLSTSAAGGSSSITLSWLASGVSATGAADPAVTKYNVYQGDSSQLAKVAEVRETFSASPTRSVLITGVGATNSCFALTAQTEDSTESPLSAVVCRDE